MRVLVVVDAQYDFVDGALGSVNAQANSSYEGKNQGLCRWRYSDSVYQRYSR